MNVWILFYDLNVYRDGFYCQSYASYELAVLAAWDRLAYVQGKDPHEMASDYVATGEILSDAIEGYKGRMYILKSKVIEK